MASANLIAWLQRTKAYDEESCNPESLYFVLLESQFLECIGEDGRLSTPVKDWWHFRVAFTERWCMKNARKSLEGKEGTEQCLIIVEIDIDQVTKVEGLSLSRGGFEFGLHGDFYFLSESDPIKIEKGDRVSIPSSCFKTFKIDATGYCRQANRCSQEKACALSISN